MKKKITEKKLDEISVSLSLDKFKELFKKEKKKEFIKVKYIINDILYVGKVKDDSIFLRMKITLTSFSDEYQIINLIPNNSVIKNYNSSKKVEFGYIDNGYKLLLNQKGKIDMEFDLHIPFYSERKNSFIFNPPMAGKFYFLIPVAESKISIPNISDINYEYFENSTKIETNISFGRQEISWSTKKLAEKIEKNIPKIEKIDAVIYGEIKTSIFINEVTIKATSIIDYRIYKSAIDYFDLEIFDGKIINIDGYGVKNYTINNDIKDINKVRIYTERLISETFNIVITYEKRYNSNKDEVSKEISLPILKLIDVNREKGKISLSSSSNIELSILKTEKLSKIDINELPQEFKNDIALGTLLAFQYFSTPYKLNLNILKHEEIPVVIAIADYAIINSVLLKDGKLLHQIDLKVRNNSKTSINFLLTENSTPINAIVNNKTVKPVRGEDNSLMIPIEKSTEGESILNIKFTFTTEIKKMINNSSIFINIGKLDIPIKRLFWSISLPEDYNYKNFRGDLELTNKFNFFDTYPNIEIPIQGNKYKFEGYFLSNEIIRLKLNYKKKFSLFNKNNVKIEN